ncbi:MAG TPA: tRNA (adenosine(37)-N6)-threonylcarbamoyltransferase complex dimerization subunit type 1 TsaB [Candidatus Saccharimonadales bacterium]|nr:tRNA (adenosine(37)-N6)-threonylcarbamoyltransferase complex dimerization subunit type 1 TsaB [Candidatus Saccharimonadales bacterium]
MLILTVRTDKPEAELGLFDGEQQLGYQAWQAHRKLAETIHLQIEDLLKSQKHKVADLEGIVAYKGPGSFTGLRIGISVANALADSLKIPITGETGEPWVKKGVNRIMSGENDRLVQPEYGAPPHTTAPKR